MSPLIDLFDFLPFPWISMVKNGEFWSKSHFLGVFRFHVQPKQLCSLIACFSTPVDKAEYAEIDCYANFEAQWTMDRLFTRYNLWKSAIYPFTPKHAQLPNPMSCNVKDKMVWEQVFSVILMYIVGWRCVLFATPTPMTTLQFSENSQNGHF